VVVVVVGVVVAVLIVLVVVVVMVVAVVLRLWEDTIHTLPDIIMATTVLFRQ